MIVIVQQESLFVLFDVCRQAFASNILHEIISFVRWISQQNKLGKQATLKTYFLFIMRKCCQMTIFPFCFQSFFMSCTNTHTKFGLEWITVREEINMSCICFAVESESCRDIYGKTYTTRISYTDLLATAKLTQLIWSTLFFRDNFRCQRQNLHNSYKEHSSFVIIFIVNGKTYTTRSSSFL